ncbi:S9 family peptidase, partial [bacterium]|nr:S9 family peptidase [bacterium]
MFKHLRIKILIFACFLFIFIIFPNFAEGILAPVANRIPKKYTIHGKTVVDNYFWLREKKNPAVIQYLNMENAYSDIMLFDTKKLQKNLYKEMVGRIKETDLSVPVRRGDYYYFNKTKKDKQYKYRYRKKNDGIEELLLDENKLAEGKDYFSLGVFKITPSQKFVAYSVDTTGREKFTLYIKDLSNGKLLADQIPDIAYSVEWGNDEKTIFYTVLDKAERPYRVYRHTVGYSSTEDELIYEEKDEAFHVYIGKTRCNSYIFISSGSSTSSEYWILDADKPEEKFNLFSKREKDIEYELDFHENEFYIITNENAVNFKLMRTPENNFSKSAWKEFMPYSEKVKLDAIDVFKDYMVIYERRQGFKTLMVFNYATGKSTDVKFPEPVYEYWYSSNPEYVTDIFRFNYNSLVTPKTVYDYNMKNGSLKLIKQYEVLGGYRKEDYISKRLSAVAKDGTEIPISVVYKKGLVKNGKNPLFLYAYGAYGSCIDPYFSSSRLSLLDRGFVFAIAHIRGGGEMGRPWYDGGKLLNKKNTFTDFITCAESLINSKYTSKRKLVIQGESAGGLLMGAVTNMRPDLFKAVIAKVPFVDVMNTMLDASIPLTVTEYEEWGNPNKKIFY